MSSIFEIRYGICLITTVSSNYLSFEQTINNNFSKLTVTVFSKTTINVFLLMQDQNPEKEFDGLILGPQKT